MRLAVIALFVCAARHAVRYRLGLTPTCWFLGRQSADTAKDRALADACSSTHACRWTTPCRARAVTIRESLCRHHAVSRRRRQQRHANSPSLINRGYGDYSSGTGARRRSRRRSSGRSKIPSRSGRRSRAWSRPRARPQLLDGVPRGLRPRGRAAIWPRALATYVRSILGRHPVDRFRRRSPALTRRNCAACASSAARAVHGLSPGLDVHRRGLPQHRRRLDRHSHARAATA